MQAGNPAYGDFESIATVTVGAGGASNIEFTSIPSTFQHLQIRILARKSDAGVTDIPVIFNADSGSFYMSHYLLGNGSTASAGGVNTYTSFFIWYVTGSDTTASVFSGGIMDILDYKDTNKNTTVRTLMGYDANGTGNVMFSSGVYLKTNAISSIKFTRNFAQHTQIALYGIKG